MSSRRLMIVAAFAGLVAHAAAIYYYGENAPGPLITDVIQFAMGIVVAFTAIFAAKRSEPFARKVWTLAAIALALYASGQGLVTYYRHFLHAALYSPWFSSQFFFFWIVPFVFTVLVRKDRVNRQLDWL